IAEAVEGAVPGCDINIAVGISHRTLIAHPNARLRTTRSGAERNGSLKQVRYTVADDPTMIWRPIAVRSPGDVNVTVGQKERWTLIVFVGIKSDAVVCGDRHGAVRPFQAGRQVQRVQALHKSRAELFCARDQV